MKICKICAKNDILCSACSRKVEQGEITPESVKISRALEKIEEGMDFVQSFEAMGRIFIVVRSEDTGKIIGKSGKNAKSLENLTGKKIKIIGKEGGKEMLEKAIGISIAGVNKVYGAEEFYRVRISRKEKIRLKPGFEKVIKSIVGDKAEIVFE
ncbi:MAG: hypothetical protein HYW27_02970 [Candidatus Aenigmarchaeota archaeon]|nr:hypothetical protein [Candidatus Aenigmarchaeota archaeon]